MLRESKQTRKVLPEDEANKTALISVQPSARHQLTLPDHGHEDSASRGVSAYTAVFAGTHCAYPRTDGQAELTWVAGYIPRWFARLLMITHPSTNRDRGKFRAKIFSHYADIVIFVLGYFNSNHPAYLAIML